MSASLVGSEMCIRDSLAASHACLGGILTSAGLPGRVRSQQHCGAPGRSMDLCCGRAPPSLGRILAVAGPLAFAAASPALR
eukprot:10009689-Alexandrium_andersonii.AAC.1